MLDVLQQAGIAQADKLLPSLFSVGNVGDGLLESLEKAITPDEASHELLRDMGARMGLTRWSSAGTTPREALSVVQLSEDCQLATGPVTFQEVKGVRFGVSLRPAEPNAETGQYNMLCMYGCMLHQICQ